MTNELPSGLGQPCRFSYISWQVPKPGDLVDDENLPTGMALVERVRSAEKLADGRLLIGCDGTNC